MRHPHAAYTAQSDNQAADGDEGIISQSPTRINSHRPSAYEHLFWRFNQRLWLRLDRQLSPNSILAGFPNGSLLGYWGRPNNNHAGARLKLGLVPIRLNSGLQLQLESGMKRCSVPSNLTGVRLKPIS